MSQAFGMGPMGFGSLSGLLESVDAMKKAWSNFSLPSSLAPTMDLDELDKRIADLKTVEQWLNVNLTMLRGTIQGMEIQRGTVAAIRAFGQAVTPDAGAMASAASQAAQAAQEAARAATQDAVRPSPATAQATASATEPGGGEQAENPMAKGSQAMAGAAVTPSAWWNLLQSQFQQVAQAAMTNPLAASASAATQAAAAAARSGAAGGSTPGGATGRSRATKTGASTARKQAAPKGAGGTRARGAATGEPTSSSRKAR